MVKAIKKQVHSIHTTVQFLPVCDCVQYIPLTSGLDVRIQFPSSTVR